MMAMTAAQCMDLLIEAGLYLSGALYDLSLIHIS